MYVYPSPTPTSSSTQTSLSTPAPSPIPPTPPPPPSVHVSPVICPNFIGQDVSTAKEIAESLGLEVSVTGTGVRVTNQVPAPDTVIKQGSTVELKAILPDY
ncbi:MAG: PASTA domain-containing protein [Nitrospirae bacterium]|nr:PASTA domain-containing protein [Nitrospirota bacterium]MBF0591854.1 PASTA domain-containing protein [Nitrospirota bacterium]